MELLKYLDAESDKLHEENISSNDDFRTVNHSFVEGFNYALAIVQGFEIELNDNQKIVLEWLKEQVSIGNDLQYVLWEFTDNVYEEPAEYSVSEQTKAWLELTEQEQFQVLTAFAEWGMEQEEE